MDSMTEMFYDECSGILREIRKGLQMGHEDGWNNQEAVQEIFRGVHTLKADSAMMLYEALAELSSVLESLLYCFRGEGKKVTDVERFEKIINAYLDFFEQETDKLANGSMPNDPVNELEAEIKDFVAAVTEKMAEDEKEEYHKAISKPRRQVFYIASASDEEMPALKQESQKSNSTDTMQAAEVVAKKLAEENPADTKNRKKYMLSSENRELICRSARDLTRLIDNIEYSFGNDDKGSISKEQFERLKRMMADLAEVKKELVNTDFVPVARKMEIVVDEMSEKLQKPVKLVVKGENTLVDSEKREAISGALIHIIRNAVDHGIEDMEERERMGKSPMGLIKLRFSTENGHLKIAVKDDGAGIDTKKVLESAEKKKLLKKAPELYSEKEIYNLLLISGMTTRDEANEYSGRGVGMDVINHNVKTLGGKLKISSKKGLGTTVTMKF